MLFTGRVPHHEVPKYLSVIDIMPFPRKPYEVCEKVSPLKPFESMATQKTVLVSSCEALTEIVQDGQTGLVFEKGSVEDLTKKIEILIKDSELRKKLSVNSMHWVRKERDWAVVAEKSD
ncbi:MAG: glycosyltransferase [Bdellovibrionota bacterium]